MNIIRTIDLWTEPSSNNIECFSGAFVDGFENDSIPFEKYKIVENCNCIITTNRADLNIKNNDTLPIRLKMELYCHALLVSILLNKFVHTIHNRYIAILLLKLLKSSWYIFI